MAFNGTEGGAISIEHASEMTAAYRSENPEGRLGLFMGKEVLLSILNQTGCKGIRVYFAKDIAHNENELVFVGADANENDMLTIVADNGFPCPSRCGSKNPLNC